MSTTAEDVLREQRRAVEAAILVLRRRRAEGGLTQAEVDEINEQLTDLEDQLAMINARLDALGAAPIAGPDPQTFAIVRDRADRIERATADNLTLAAIVRLVDEALSVSRA